MTSKTALRGVMSIATACLLTGGATWAQDTSTGAAGAPRDGYRAGYRDGYRDGHTDAPSDATAPSDTGRATGMSSQAVTGDQTTGTSGRQAASGTGSASDDQATMAQGTGAANAAAADQPRVSVAGRIQRIDRADGTLEIQGVDRQLKLDQGTDVTRNGSQASFGDLHEGEQVRASFEDGLPAHVESIDIRSGGTSPTSGGR